MGGRGARNRRRNPPRRAAGPPPPRSRLPSPRVRSVVHPLLHAPRSAGRPARAGGGGGGGGKGKGSRAELSEISLSCLPLLLARVGARAVAGSHGHGQWPPRRRAGSSGRQDRRPSAADRQAAAPAGGLAGGMLAGSHAGVWGHAGRRAGGRVDPDGLVPTALPAALSSARLAHSKTYFEGKIGGTVPTHVLALSRSVMSSVPARADTDSKWWISRTAFADFYRWLIMKNAFFSAFFLNGGFLGETHPSFSQEAMAFQAKTRRTLAVAVV